MKSNISKQLLICILISFIFFASCKEEEKKVAIETTAVKKSQPYPYGLLPEKINLTALDTFYSKWKTKYITSNGCPVGKRVLFDDRKHTVSEGIAYGLLASVYMKDEALFDDLLLYYQNYLDSNGLMHWKIDENGTVVGENAATDADEDVAFALLVAHSKINKSKGYKKEAIRVINAMYKTMVRKDTYILKAGDDWKDENGRDYDVTNPSYFAPGYFKLFAKVTGNNGWIKVADECYITLFKSMNQDTGLVPDWCKANGETPGEKVEWAKNHGKTFFYDAIRTPWRISMDYLWTGDERAYKYCNTIAGFVDKVGVTNIKDGYKLNGDVFSERHTSTFIGCFGFGILASNTKNQDLVNAIYSENLKIDNDNYFNETLKVITLIGQSGLFTMPEDFYKD
ncbi:glycosyl hydrolase family 8 [uncultured Lacinutrix sp.]|uniref:glycosyl hydrolase family 8 n=1 Tax=uncultured Lacinutrix sp. TaxID=574032 RepID=UPI002629E0F4|nr:glycosyl hydrolase family 8 [uncultured Lacinutrix sp.]